jgi:hypothetical protein
LKLADGILTTDEPRLTQIISKKIAAKEHNEDKRKTFYRRERRRKA